MVIFDKWQIEWQKPLLFILRDRGKFIQYEMAFFFLLPKAFLFCFCILFEALFLTKRITFLHLLIFLTTLKLLECGVISGILLSSCMNCELYKHRGI